MEDGKCKMKENTTKNKQKQVPEKPIQTEQKVYKTKILLSLLLPILILTAIVFSNSLHNDFTNWDDNQYVADNQYVKDFSVSGVKTIMFSRMPASGGAKGTRFTLLVFALEYNLWGLNPVPYHVINLLLHLANVALVFLLSLLLFRRIEIASIAALFFGIHPMHVESVAWISQLKDVLYTFFFLLSLIAYHYYIKRNRKIKYLLFSFLAFFFSYHAKLSAVVLPFLLFLMDYYYKRSFTKKLLYEKAPYFILLFYVFTKPLFRQLLHHSTVSLKIIEVPQMVVHYAYFERFFLACYSILFYTIKFFTPFNLYSLHPYPVKTNGMLPLEYYISPFVLAAVIGLVIWGLSKMKKYKRELIFSLLFYFISISMFSHLIPIKGVVVVADRYTYIPYVGLFFVFGFFYCLAVDKKIQFAQQIKIALLSVFFISTISFSFASYNRNKVWKNSITLFSDVIEKKPEIDLAYINRGNAKRTSGDFKAALDDYNKAMQLRKAGPYSYNNRGTIKANLQDYQGAMDDFNKAIELFPNYLEAYCNRGKLKKTLNDYKGMMDDYNQVISLNPKYSLAYLDRGVAKYFLKDYDGAMQDFNEVIKLNPTAWEAYNHRGNTKNSLHDYQGAINDFNKVIALNPNSPEAYNGRGFSENNLQDYYNALSDLEKAIALKPDFVEAYNNLGMVFQNQKDFKNAIKNFDKAIELNSKFAEAYNNRAIVLCNTQNFQQAAIDLDKAIELNPLLADAYNNRGNLKSYYGDFQSSIQDFNKVLELDPRNAFAFANRGNSKLKLNKLNEACDDWRKAIELGLTQVNEMIKLYCK